MNGSDSSTLGKTHELADEDLMVIRVDAEGRVVYVNPTYQGVTGFSTQEIKAMSIRDCVTGLPPQVLIDAASCVRGGKPWNGVVQAICRTGDTYWCRVNASPLVSNGKTIGSLMVFGKASSEEANMAARFYTILAASQQKKIGWKQGRLVRFHLWGNAAERLRTLGLARHIWGPLAVLLAVGLTGLVALAASISPLAFWAASVCLGVVAAATGLYISRAVVRPLQDAVLFANQIAAGNLCGETHSTRIDEIGDLVHVLNRVTVNMRATVMDVRDGMHLIQHAATEIATGVHGLSSRTELQASNLEETAASMEQVNSVVQNNADAAHQASELAKSTCATAEAGAEVVSRVIATMDQISQSSNKIGDITALIDGIAFQTNILALNAAVEAARAGDSGRGFAVVASEVRNLSQRTAQAAKEIKHLIATNVGTISEGSRLVDTAGQAIEEIVSQVRNVTGLVGQIANASQEQAAAVDQMSRAVDQLEEMTQENSAMVEEHTAATSSLKSQNDRLVETLCVFTL
ncbi:methyl-accepting chemotaxis protein [Paraburkholderia adhaesiva]|uniref:methyl-accepting chemotaxis protein n=1 Tax=Paraburkholderia adhaesiva TaxID=2883244 RepID=UPI001F236524|nr:methyl-accepting chemotaxis protein [Paraburkholderia adhaesiva]